VVEVGRFGWLGTSAAEPNWLVIYHRRSRLAAGCDGEAVATELMLVGMKPLGLNWLISRIPGGTLKVPDAL
jgi:hypothetical protein